MKRSSPLLLAGCLLALTGCVRSYRVADVRSRLDRTVSKIDQATRETEADVAEMRKICEPLLSGHPPLREILERLDATVVALRSHQQEVAGLRRRLDQVAQPEVCEDSPEGEQIRQLQADYTAIARKVEQTVERYKTDANQLLAAVQQAQGR